MKWFSLLHKRSLAIYHIPEIEIREIVYRKNADGSRATITVDSKSGCHLFDYDLTNDKESEMYEQYTQLLSAFLDAPDNLCAQNTVRLFDLH